MKMQLPERVPRLTIIIIASLLLNGIVVFLVLLFFLQVIGPNNAVQDGDIAVVKDSQKLIPGQAITLNVDPITVYVPPFAVPLPGNIFMVMRPGDLYSVASKPEWRRPQVIEVQFRTTAGILIREIVLSTPMRICFELTEAEWRRFKENTTSYVIQYYDLNSDPPVWLSLPTTRNSDQLQLCARTVQLSSFALAVQSDVAIPVTGPSAAPSVSTTLDLVATRTLQPTPSVLLSSTNDRRTASVSLPTFTLTPTITLQPSATPTRTSTSTLHPTTTLSRTSTSTLRPTPTPTRTLRPTATPTRTLRPTATPTKTIRPTATSTRTPRPTATNPPPTATNRPPTATNPPPTETNPPPTATNPPPTATNPPPTATNPPPTATNPPPTATNPPPTATSQPPTATDVPPTDPPPATDTPPAPSPPPAETPTP